VTATARAVVDASCVIRAVVDGSEEALGWLDSIEARETDASAPDLMFAEVANSLVRHVRTGRMSSLEADTAISTIAALPIATTGCRMLAESALSLALGRGVTAYDAHYLALAEAEEAVLVTADRRLAQAASRSILLD
jgi:predicted nucleic acid-binding protein